MAEALFEEMGMSMSTAFTIFVKQVIRERRIPFTISFGDDSNDETKAAMLEAKAIIKCTLKDNKLVDDMYYIAKHPLYSLPYDTNEMRKKIRGRL